jgi:hypothetical protein
LIVAQVYLVTGGSVYAVTEELTESRLYAEESDPHSAVMHLIRADEQLSAEAMRSPGSRDEL